VSSESIGPDLDGISSPSETLDESLTQLILDPEQNRQAVTSLYLGLFSVSPILFIFQAWTFIPALILCGWVLWKVWQLHEQGINAVMLQVAAWVMVIMSIDSFFIYPDLSYQVRASAFEGTFLFSVITSVIIAGIFVLPIFALLAVIYGFKAKLHVFGITAGVIHLICWLVFGISVLGYAFRGN
jgi:hypothetical protein